MIRKQYQPALIGAAAVLVLVIVLAAVIGRRSGTADQRAEAVRETDAALSAGMTFLKSRESLDPQTVDDVLKEQRRQKLLAMRDQLQARLEADETAVWSMFEDYMLLGDSRAYGYEFYSYMPEDRVRAYGGANIRAILEFLDDVKAMNPSSLYVCYGVNDIGIGIWPTAEEYAAELQEILGQVHQELPEVSVYVSAILPVKDPAYDQCAEWYNIPQYNAALQKMCDETDGVWFVDCADLIDLYGDMVEPDGIHLQFTFYPHWAARLITEEFSSQLDWDGDSAPDAAALPAAGPEEDIPATDAELPADAE